MMISPIKYLNVIFLLPFLCSCAHLPKKSLVNGKTSVDPEIPKIVNASGSIFQTGQPRILGYQPMFEDRRPRHVGDMLTVVLQENVSASKSSSVNAGRNSGMRLSAKAVPNLLDGVMGKGKIDTELSGGNDFKGEGGANAKNTFNGTITVTVHEVLVNGNLKVIGEKQIAINQGTEFIRFSGVVSPETISSNNTVTSTQVADVRLEYIGNGYIDEAQTMGWLQRLFLNLSPL